MRIDLIVASLVIIAIMSVAALNASSVKHWLGNITMPIREGMVRQRNVMIPMRDGIKLATDIYRPGWGTGQYPVILMRTTYGAVPFSDVRQFVKHDYAVVVQHVRGRFNSEGDYQSPYRNARQDGYDTIDWIIAQPWAADKIGSYGCSYLGESQIILGAENHPNHIAMIAIGAGGGIGKAEGAFGYFGVFENGVLNLASSLGWFTAEGAIQHKVSPRPADYAKRMQEHLNHLPVSELNSKMVPYETGFNDLINHPLTDSWWDNEGYINQNDQFSAATLHINDWFDQTTHNTFRLAKHMGNHVRHPRAVNQPLIIAPGLHCSAGKLDEGEVTIGDMVFHYQAKNFQKLYIDWFDHWLKGQDTPQPAPFEYYVIHAGEWRKSDQWPPVTSRNERLFLVDGGNLRKEASPDHQSSQYNQFAYDPMDPVPTLGGPICCTYRQQDRPGPLDQSSLKNRTDILNYQTAPLEKAVELEGNPSAVLFVATDAKDTDFTLKLIDHYPDGRAYNLQDGVIRLRYRQGIENPMLAEPGRIYRVELELRPLAYQFKQGHSIGIQISSSNFPRLVRNLNTGADQYTDAQTVIANNRVYLSGNNASYIELPFRQRETLNGARHAEGKYFE